MVNFRYRFFSWIIFALLFPLQLFALGDISVSASIDPTTLAQGWPIKGTLEITHYTEEQVEESSATLEGKPLKISLLRNVKISPSSPLMVSIYHFTLPPQNKGSYTLAPISVKIGGKTYQTFPVAYDVKGPVSAAATAPGEAEKSTLKLEAFVEGPKELYPGQKTKLVYRYIYEGNIDLSKEVLPMLEAKGMQKIGRNEVKNYAEGNASVFETSQVVQALKPGEYSWGPSTIEGVVYVEDALGNKQFTTTKLTSEAPPVKVMVKAFPEKGKPASFNGAFGQFTFTVKLLSPAKISVGDPIVLDAAISGKTSNWDSVELPEICCQPGFGGFFKMSDLPSIGKMEGETKHFTINMNPLNPAIKSIPAIQFSFFEPESGQYKIALSVPIALSVAPMKDIAQVEQSLSKKSLKSQETEQEWLQIYQQMPHLPKMVPLDTEDLKNKSFGSWWALWLIPLCLLGLVFQFKLKDYLVNHACQKKAVTSDTLYQEMLKASAASPQFFQLLHQALLLRLFEQGVIPDSEVAPEDLPSEGKAGEVRSFLIHIDALRYTSKMTDSAIYKLALEKGKKLFAELKGRKNE